MLRLHLQSQWKRQLVFGCCGSSRRFHTTRRLALRDARELPDKIVADVEPCLTIDACATGMISQLKWPEAPRNILIVRKENDSRVRDSMLQFYGCVQRFRSHCLTHFQIPEEQIPYDKRDSRCDIECG